MGLQQQTQALGSRIIKENAKLVVPMVQENPAWGRCRSLAIDFAVKKNLGVAFGFADPAHYNSFKCECMVGVNSSVIPSMPTEVDGIGMTERRFSFPGGRSIRNDSHNW